MKYIRLYESFDKTEIDQTLREICLELVDDGYNINFHIISLFGTDDEYFYSIEIDARLNGYIRLLIFSEIKEYLLRMKDYLGNNYIRFRYHTGEVWREIELNDDTDIELIYLAQIVYRII